MSQSKPFEWCCSPIHRRSQLAFSFKDICPFSGWKFLPNIVSIFNDSPCLAVCIPIHRDQWPGWPAAEITLGMGSANEGRCYKVTPPLIGWAHTQHDLYCWHVSDSQGLSVGMLLTPWIFCHHLSSFIISFNGLLSNLTANHDMDWLMKSGLSLRAVEAYSKVSVTLFWNNDWKFLPNMVSIYDESPCLAVCVPIHIDQWPGWPGAGITLGMGTANERQCYKVTSSLIDQFHRCGCSRWLVAN